MGCERPASWVYAEPGSAWRWLLCDGCRSEDPRGARCTPIADAVPAHIEPERAGPVVADRGVRATESGTVPAPGTRESGVCRQCGEPCSTALFTRCTRCILAGNGAPDYAQPPGDPSGAPVQCGDLPLPGALYFAPQSGYYRIEARGAAVPGGVICSFRDGAIRVHCTVAQWQADALKRGDLLIAVALTAVGAPPAEPAPGAPDELERMLELFRQEWDQLPARLAQDGIGPQLARDLGDCVEELVELVVEHCRALSGAHVDHVVRVLSGA